MTYNVFGGTLNLTKLQSPLLPSSTIRYRPKGQWFPVAGKVTVALVESNDRLLVGYDLVTCRQITERLGSALCTLLHNVEWSGLSYVTKLVQLDLDLISTTVSDRYLYSAIYSPGPKFTYDLRSIFRQFSDLRQSYDNWRIHKTFTTVL